MADKVVARAGMWKVIVFALFIAVFLLFISVIPLGVNLSFILFIPEWLFFQ